MRNQKGITLIALIITIVVMLILVSVSINVVIQTGLFKAAQKATGDTKIKRDEEIELSTGMITIIEDGVKKEVDINSFGELEVTEIGKRLVLPDFECQIQDTTTFADLIEDYDEFTEETVDGETYVKFNGQYIGTCGYGVYFADMGGGVVTAGGGGSSTHSKPSDLVTTLGRYEEYYYPDNETYQTTDGGEHWWSGPFLTDYIQMEGGYDGSLSSDYGIIE